MIALRLTLLALGLLQGCLLLTPADRPVRLALEPAAVQPAPYLTVLGDEIVATLSGVSLGIRYADEEGLDRFYRRRYQLEKNPLRGMLEQFTFFYIKVQNRSRRQVAFDPLQVHLVDQKGQRLLPVDYTELYRQIGSLEGATEVERALRGSLLSSYVVVTPNQEKEGLLLFRRYAGDAKALFLQFTSLYIGGTPQSLLFQFRVSRSPRKS